MSFCFSCLTTPFLQTAELELTARSGNHRNSSQFIDLNCLCEKEATVPQVGPRHANSSSVSQGSTTIPSLPVYNSLNSLFSSELLEKPFNDESLQKSQNSTPAIDLKQSDFRSARRRSTRVSVNSAPGRADGICECPEETTSLAGNSDSCAGVLGNTSVWNRFPTIERVLQEISAFPQAPVQSSRTNSGSTIASSEPGNSTDRGTTSDFIQRAKFNIVQDLSDLSDHEEYFSDERIDLVPWLPLQDRRDATRKKTPITGPLADWEPEMEISGGGGKKRLKEWCLRVARFLLPDNQGDEVCHMLMQDGEEKVPKRSHFKKLVGRVLKAEELSGEARRHSKRTRLAQFLRLRRKNEVGDPLEWEKEGLEMQGRFILGNATWLKAKRGILIWASFGIAHPASLSKFERLVVFLNDQTGYLKLARLTDCEEKLGFGPNQRKFVRESTRQNLWNLNPVTIQDKSVCGRNFPIDTLIEIDASNELQEVLSSEIFSNENHEFQNVKCVAMWSTHTPEPLVCLSSDIGDIEELIIIIRFLQFYHGMTPAMIWNEKRLNLGRSNSNFSS